MILQESVIFIKSHKKQFQKNHLRQTLLKQQTTKEKTLDNQCATFILSSLRRYHHFQFQIVKANYFID
jgi:hypothetical protein